MVQISTVATPQGEDINSLLDGHTPSVLLDLLKNRKPPLATASLTECNLWLQYVVEKTAELKYNVL
jgi:hypothetical protein